MAYPAVSTGFGTTVAFRATTAFNSLECVDIN